MIVKNKSFINKYVSLDSALLICFKDQINKINVEAIGEESFCVGSATEYVINWPRN